MVVNQEEGGEEYASANQNSAPDHEASGLGAAVRVFTNGESRVEDALANAPFEGQEEGNREEDPPSESCSGDESTDIASGGGGREYATKQCKRHKPSYYKNTSKDPFNVRIRTKSGSWFKLFDTYCGIVGGAFLTPGVDVFGAPAEIACGGYGVYRAVETIVEAL